MGDYTQMAGHYDAIMTSGYYDYDAIVSALRAAGARSAERISAGASSRVAAGPTEPSNAAPAPAAPAPRILEIGVGTGLIVQRLIQAEPGLDITGIDLTSAMLEIAAKRLADYPQIELREQNVVHLDLEHSYDLAFSYGGVWYFTDEDELISHIRDDAAGLAGLARVAAHLHPGATLLLGIQAAHQDYSAPISNGMLYAQKITPISGGFRKDYSLSDDGQQVMAQTTDYRVYSFGQALEMLQECGLDHVPAAPGQSLFHTFRKR